VNQTACRVVSYVREHQTGSEAGLSSLFRPEVMISSLV
jgi:hypothetical protein